MISSIYALWKLSSEKDRSSKTSQAELQTPSSHGTSFSAVLEWFLERVNTRFLSTATPAQPLAGLIITTKLPFVAAITRRRCRGKTLSTLVRRDGKRERDEGGSGEDSKGTTSTTRGKTRASDDSRAAKRSRTQFCSRVSRRQPFSGPTESKT